MRPYMEFVYLVITLVAVCLPQKKWGVPRLCAYVAFIAVCVHGGMSHHPRVPEVLRVVLPHFIRLMSLLSFAGIIQSFNVPMTLTEGQINDAFKVTYNKEQNVTRVNLNMTLVVSWTLFTVVAFDALNHCLNILN